MKTWQRSGPWKRLVKLLLLIPMISGFSFWRPITWESINLIIDKRFPDVKNLSTDALHSIYGNETFILIDVRSSEEFRVSRIQGAHNIEDPDKINFPKNSKIILYCSVGYRSGKMAEILQKKGYTEVFNLRGSLFEWANKGYPLTDGEKTTTKAHPYNSQWGVLLNVELHSDITDGNNP